VNQNVYNKISYRSSTEGIIALAEEKNHKLEKLKFKSTTPIIMILDGIEKPGNIGALLRTSDAAKVDAVFIVNQKTDLYNPNIIRSSIGCLFSNQIILSNTKETIDFLNKTKIKILSTSLTASKQYQKINYKQACAIVLGSEDKGISKEWYSQSNELIYIPMEGHIDSLNVSNSGAIIIYEAKRQRNFK
jgi:TrmH family RNA methyltransferase